MKYDNIITKEQLLEKINERIDHYQIRLELINIIDTPLKRFDGKKITKRIETAINLALPKRTVYLDNDYSMFKLVIWGDSSGLLAKERRISYNERFTSLIGYKDNPIFDHDKFIEYNQCHLLNEKRIKSLKRAIENIDDLVKLHNDICHKKERFESYASNLGIDSLIK